MKFTVNFDDIPTGAVINTFKTIAALIAADTVGHRCRLISLTAGPSEDSPKDLNVALQLKRIDSVSGGTAGTAGGTPTPAKKDSLSRAAVITAKTNYSAEPTTYGDVLWQADMNRRNTICKEWSPEDAPVITRNQHLGLLAAPRTAAATSLSGSLEFEEF